MSDLSKLDALLPQTVTEAAKKAAVPSPSKLEGDSFSDVLKSALNDVNDAQFTASDAVQKVLSGESTDIHETMIALQKADVSLKMMLEVRNKILEAYQEVMRTQV